MSSDRSPEGQSVNVSMMGATLIALLGLQEAAVQAQPQYPVKAVRIIVPSAPGSAPDIMARAVGQKLTEILGQPFIIDDRPGAGGIIGCEAAAKSPADGYTLIMSNAGAHAVNASLYPKLPYNPVTDFAPISLVAMAPNILIVHPALPARSVRELIALAKSKPGELTFGSGGNGSTAHLSAEMFKTMARINIVHVPFKGSPAAVIAVISGQIALAMPNIPPALPQVRSGRLRALAVTTAKRSAAVPELPTVAEAGLPGYEATAWFGVLAPAATPPQIIAQLNTAIIKALRTRDIQERIAAEGGDVVGNTAEEFAAIIKRDIAKWATVVKASGARPD
jgi:tripartite-type tricarboxylate transporter receptor subunit TctC